MTTIASAPPAATADAAPAPIDPLALPDRIKFLIFGIMAFGQFMALVDIQIVAAGQSDRGMKFAADYADYNFTLGTGINTPKAFAPANQKLIDAAAVSGRDVGAYVLFMVIADETDALAEAKWQLYKDGVDREALAWMASQGGRDKNASATSTARTINLPEGAVNTNMGTLIGSYEKVAALLDEVAEVPGTKGIMLTFDDFIIGMDQFGQRIQPLMKSRASVV